MNYDDPHIRELRRNTFWSQVNTAIMIALFVLVLCSLLARGQELTYVHSPADSVIWAAEITSALPVEDRPFRRFLYSPADSTGDWTHAANFVVNSAVSQTSVICLADHHKGGWLISYDLRRLTKWNAGLEDLIKTWDELAALDQQYYFAGNVLLPVAPYKHANGKTYSHRWFRKASFGPHINPAAAALLCSNTHCWTPICRTAHFVYFASSQKDRLNAGFYYRFLLPADVRKPKSGTQKDAVLDLLGADLEKSRKIDADHRVGMKQSQVTGKPRVVRRVRTLAGDWLETLDIRDEDVRADQQALLNLIDVEKRHFAEEVLFDRPNGLVGYLLFDAKGALVNVVPQNVATDDTVPNPHPENLQPMISCVRCHATSDAWQPCPNDVLKITRAGLDILDDFNAVKDGLSQREVVAELVALYGGEFEPLLRLARDRTAAAVFVTAGGKSIPELVSVLSEIYSREAFDMVTPAAALAELGYTVTEGGEIGALWTLFPKRFNPQTGKAFESYVAGVLKTNDTVTRIDFNREYAEMAVRAQNYEAAKLLKKEG